MAGLRGDTSVSCESGRAPTSATSGVPSSRQKLSVSSSNARLHVGQGFIARLTNGSSLVRGHDHGDDIEHHHTGKHDQTQDAGDDPDPGKLLSGHSFWILLNLRERDSTQNDRGDRGDWSETHPAHRDADYSQYHRGHAQALIRR